jgi:hypothetical protein
VLIKMSEDQEHTTMKGRLCGMLVTAQLMGAWLAVAQTNTRPTTKQQSSAIQVNAVRIGRINPAIAVSPRSLDFASVAVGRTSKLAFTVQNVGVGILTGAAMVSAPFRIVAGNSYVLESSQSQVITVQYVPKAIGMNITVVRLTGGVGASVTVAGSAVQTSPAAPAPLQNLRLIAGR